MLKFMLITLIGLSALNAGASQAPSLKASALKGTYIGTTPIFNYQCKVDFFETKGGKVVPRISVDLIFEEVFRKWTMYGVAEKSNIILSKINSVFDGCHPNSKSNLCAELKEENNGNPNFTDYDLAFYGDENCLTISIGGNGQAEGFINNDSLEGGASFCNVNINTRRTCDEQRN